MANLAVALKHSCVAIISAGIPGQRFSNVMTALVNTVHRGNSAGTLSPNRVVLLARTGPMFWVVRILSWLAILGGLVPNALGKASSCNESGILVHPFSMGVVVQNPKFLTSLGVAYHYPSLLGEP